MSCLRSSYSMILMIFYILKKCLLFTLQFFTFIHLFLVARVFVVTGLSLVVVSGGTLQWLLAGFLSQWLLVLRSTGSRPVGFASCGPQAYLLRGRCNTPDQGLNLCPLHWQADSQPLDHQGSPALITHLPLALPSCY